MQDPNVSFSKLHVQAANKEIRMRFENVSSAAVSGENNQSIGNVCTTYESSKMGTNAYNISRYDSMNRAGVKRRHEGTMFEYSDDKASFSHVMSDGNDHAPIQSNKLENGRQNPIDKFHEVAQRNQLREDWRNSPGKLRSKLIKMKETQMIRRGKG